MIILILTQDQTLIRLTRYHSLLQLLIYRGTDRILALIYSFLSSEYVRIEILKNAKTTVWHTIHDIILWLVYYGLNTEYGFWSIWWLVWLIIIFNKLPAWWHCKVSISSNKHQKKCNEMCCIYQSDARYVKNIIISIYCSTKNERRKPD